MRTVWDEGATADLRVTVEGAAGNTQVSVTLTDPDGVETEPLATSNGDRTEWTVTPQLDAPGIWWLVAEVTGAGEGVKRYRLRVRPLGPIVPTGRVYATTRDLARHMQDAPPVDGDRLLVRASEIVDALTFAALYRTDEEGYPTALATREAFREATSAQAAFMAAGRASEFGTSGEYAQVSIGSVSLGGRGGATTGATTVDGIPVAPLAMAVLRRHDLTPNRAQVIG